MPEIIPNHVPSPRTLLAWDGTAYRPVSIDAAGQLQIDVLSSVMDPLAATAAAQALALAQLQLIEDLRDALQSVATDRLQVRGEDQLFSIEGVVADHSALVLPGADGSQDSRFPGPGEYWVIKNICAWDATRALTKLVFALVHDGAVVFIHEVIRAFAAGDRYGWSSTTILDPSDTIRVWFIGGQAGDAVNIDLTGYSMTLET